MPDWERYVRDRLALSGLRPERERRIIRELAASLEDIYQDALRNGTTAEEAEQAAFSHIEDWERLSADLRSADPGGVEPRLDRLADRLLESPRDEPGKATRPWTGLARDILYSTRRLASAPGFTAVAILILAIGIGTTALMFNLVDTILFRPLPLPRGHEVVRIFEDGDDGRPGTCSYPTFVDLAAQHDVFSVTAASIVGDRASWLRDDGEIQRVSLDFAGSTYFRLVGLPLALGRAFEAREDVTGGPPAAIVSHRLWSTALGGDPAVLGKPIRLSGAPITIVGVGPRGFDGIVAGHTVDFWVSLSGLAPLGGEYAGGTLQRRDDHWFNILARVKTGVSVERAQAAASVLAARLGKEYPAYHKGRKLTVFRAAEVRLQPGLDGSLYPAGAALMTIAGLVLLVGCANLAGLLLGAGWKRGHELSIRMALGSTRWRLVRQLLIESTMLGLLGGAAGVALAVWGSRVLAAVSARLALPVQLSLDADWRVFAFSLAVSILVGVAFGLGPALRVTRPDLVSALKEPDAVVPGRRPGTGRYRWTLRGGFVVAQVSASMALLVAGGSLAAGVRDAQRVNLGFGASGRVALLQADASEAGLDSERGGALLRDFAERVRGLPGVEAVTWTTRPPVTRAGSSTLVIDEHTRRTGAETAEVDSALVGTTYFETLRVPLRHGRYFTAADSESGKPVAVVSEAMARRYWGRANVVGERYRHQGSPDSWVEIVGVVGDVKVESPTEEPTPIFYRTAPAGGFSRLYTVARTAGPPDAVARAMQQLFRQQNPGVPVLEAGTMASHVAASITLQRIVAVTVGLLSMVALLLAAIGLYGVVAGSVAQRTSEIGIRMALGARPGQVVAMLVREVMVLVAAGSAVGLTAALLLAPGLRSLVFGVRAQDPLAAVSVTALLALVALLATWLPARAAVGVGPLAAMRQK